MVHQIPKMVYQLTENAYFFVLYVINDINECILLPWALSEWLIMLHTSAQFARECVSPRDVRVSPFSPHPFQVHAAPGISWGNILRLSGVRSEKIHHTSITFQKKTECWILLHDFDVLLLECRVLASIPAWW